MQTLTRSQNTSAIKGKSGDIYRFNLDYFWDGEWVHEQKKDENQDDLFYVTRKEYLQICGRMPKSGCVSQDPAAHMAFYRVLLKRQYPHFGITGIKCVYLILCLHGYYGNKYKKIKIHANLTLEQSLKRLIGGRADCSHASPEFWEACYSRIKQEDISERISLAKFTQAERDIWRAFVRRANDSCNKKK